jgi:hypothetical protein
MEGGILVHFTPKGPGLAPRDFHIFGPMKEALRRKRRRFSSDEEVIGTVQNCLKTQPKKKKHFLNELTNLRKAGKGALKSKGNYVEN